MRYQLVLQFRGDSLADYDQMIALEDRLIEALGTSADLDGHDCGSGETNIFIVTTDPAASFSRIRQMLKQEGQLDAVRAAYREGDGDQYTVLWPDGATREFRVV